MKNRDLSNAIGNIDLKYVDEAESFTAKRMSLTKIVSLAACIAIIVTAIPLSHVLNREDANTDAPVVSEPVVETTEPDNTNKTPAKIVYCDSSLKEVFKGSSLDIEVRDSSEIDLDLSSKIGDIEAGAEIPAKLYYTIGGNDLICTFDTAYATKLANSKSASLQDLANIATYKVEGSGYEGAYLNYSYETNQITEMWLLDITDGFTVEGNLTSDEVKKLAERDLAELYGDNFASIYTLESVKQSSTQSCISYRRYVHGYPTEDVLRAYYNMNGELGTIYTNNFGTFEGIENDIDAEAIATAKEEALSLIDVENEPVELMYLVMDVNGDVYWFVYYIRKPIDEPRPVPWEYIYKVN